MRAISFAFFVLLAAAATTYGAVTYPGILLCSDVNQPAPEAGCQYRSSAEAEFVRCDLSTARDVILTGDDSSRPLVKCRAFNFLREVVANDAGSILVFNATLNVKWTSLFDNNHSVPSTLDQFTDLIYMYDDAGLVTVQGALVSPDANGLGHRVFSNSLHTHHYGVAPQDIWVRIDPLYSERQLAEWKN